MIHVVRLDKSFLVAGKAVPVLRGVDLDVATGEMVALVGDSGSGKSTLMNILGGLDRPSTGQLLGGRDVSRLTVREWGRTRSRDIGFVFQSFNLIPTATILENVELPLGYRGMAPGARRQRAVALLDRPGLGDHARRYPQQLSGGQQQRVAVARAPVGPAQAAAGR